MLAAEQNIQVANCSTPAQYFHLLRRQMRGGADRRGMRKPLIIFTPKRLLRHPRATSSFADLAGGGFREVLDDTSGLDTSRVARVVFCAGQIYYDLIAAREEQKVENTAIVRIEQLYPFDETRVKDVLLRYPVTCEVVWAQEEPRNMGAWRFIAEQFRPLLEPTRRELRYVGRPESASPATGSLKRHQEEQAEITREALTLGAVSKARKVRVITRRKVK